MCGIVGYIGKEKCIPKIMEGLKTLEYRGYDSAGIAYKLNESIIIKKQVGRICNLDEELNYNTDSYMGIGHTRWATHGKPSKTNSHPHRVGKITIVHNGIIENYKELSSKLSLEYNFKSDTDSEVVAALIDKLYKEENDMVKVLGLLHEYLIGSYAIGILVDGLDELYVIRKDSPLIIGVSLNGNYIASDVPAILSNTSLYYDLNNDEYAVLTPDDVVIYDIDGNVTSKKINTFEGTKDMAILNGYEHFMLKEIHDQPEVIKDILDAYLDDFNHFKDIMKGLDKYTEISIVGCGSAYHAGLVGANLIQKYSRVRVNTYIASEYRYMDHIYSKKHLIILISQSGETADTLAVLRNAKENDIDTLAIVNVFGSSIAREADRVFYIKAGIEVAVATTKAYLCQVMILMLIACYLGIKKNTLDESILDKFNLLPQLLNDILRDSSDCLDAAKLIYRKKSAFYIGRLNDYNLAKEGSLKLKEVSYIHSESYGAGELKHGSISLIKKGTPVISIISDDSIRFKTMSNIKEVMSRGASSIIISNDDIIDPLMYNCLIKVPKVNDLIDPMLIAVKMQVLAYNVAKLKGCEIDKPRNLAKSVTVE